MSYVGNYVKLLSDHVVNNLNRFGDNICNTLVIYVNRQVFKVDNELFKCNYIYVYSYQHKEYKYCKEKYWFVCISGFPIFLSIERFVSVLLFSKE